MEAKKYLKSVYYSCFVDYLGGAFVYPVFALIFFSKIPEYSIFAQNTAIHIKAFYFGLSIGVFTLGDFFGSFIFPRLSDNYGRIKLLLLLSMIGIFGQFLSIISLYQKNLNYLILSRFILGFAGSLTSVSKAVISDVSSDENRAKNFSKLSMIYALSSLIGPLIGTLFMDNSFSKWFNYITPFWILLLLYLSIFFSIVPLKEIKFRYHSEHSLNFINELKANLKIEKIRNLLLWIFFYTLSWSAFYSFLPLVLVEIKNLKQIEIGYIYSYIGLWMFLVQFFFIKYLHRFDINRIIYGCFFIDILFFSFTYPFFYGPLSVVVLLYIPVLSMTHSMIQTGISLNIANTPKNESRGLLQGLGSMTKTLPGFLGPVLASSLIALDIYLVVVFSLIALSIAILFLKYYRQIKV
jgi:DHA1 family tetracycline resistance protein-like MFS transporter